MRHQKYNFSFSDKAVPVKVMAVIDSHSKLFCEYFKGFSKLLKMNQDE